MQSNAKIYFYVLKLTFVMAAILAVLSNSLEPLHKRNKELAKKRAILSCIPSINVDEKTDAEIEAIFADQMKIVAVQEDGDVFKDDEAGIKALTKRAGSFPYEKLADIDLSLEEKLAEKDRAYPLYEYSSEKGEVFYVVSVRGNGLWDKIWGYVALTPKMTIAAVNFDHKQETPGLGAEIKDSKAFKDKFENCKIFKNDKFVSVQVKKKGVKDPTYEIQAISGATVTSDGVSEMLFRGIGYYLNYFEQLKKGGKISYS